MTAALMIYTTFPCAEEAQKTAAVLLEKELIACANIFPPHQALFRWEGKVAVETEIAVILKSREELYSRIEEEIRGHHSYDCPAIVAWSLDKGAPAYMKWVEANTCLPEG